MLAHLNKKIAAGVLTAAAATGVLAPTPDTHSNQGSGFGTAATAQAETKHKFQYISQAQGQATQWEDCGPATILMALLQNGGDVPSSYTKSDQTKAMADIRGNINGYLQTGQVVNILNQRGVSGKQHLNGDAVKAIDDIKKGKKAIILAQTGVISGEMANPGYGHYVYVSGYDKDKKTFTVNDPLKNERASYQATEDNIRAIITQPAAGNSQWVYTM
ncbi:C39 family peptidase [Corynebacterium tuberculostearicum]|uniref:C39 family peptidase n=1 Tax=Corynebacterium tuberculostearicum TaxID=38304 RepID=UPI0029351B3A|nr:C39 family peptidase [Corynebacterium tuberculostearicum]MDV2435927.1 C39 family peptidase [Corynebacterium tuberculostearicum]